MLSAQLPPAVHKCFHLSGEAEVAWGALAMSRVLAIQVKQTWVHVNYTMGY